MRLPMLLAGLLAASSASAGEQLRLSGGTTYDRDDANSTYGWELDYGHGLGEHARVTVGWLNEGHQDNDHRDGFTAQLWACAHPFEHLAVALGAGPYLFFDTARDEAHPTFSRYDNSHGLRPIYSAEITWFVDQSWLVYLRTNRIEAGAHDATMHIIGIGYQFDERPVGASLAGGTGTHQVEAFLGRTTLNSFAPERSTAYSVDYRHALTPYAEWTLGWLNEGGNEIIRRNGITSQFWLVHPLPLDGLALGIGAGAYVVVNQENQVFVLNGNGKPVRVGDDDERLAGIVSLTASYDFTPRWTARASFNRLLTRYDRDADVLLLGAGYRF